MKEYAVLDQSLSQVSQGDTVYPVVGGLVTMPVEIAHDLVQSGQITLASNVEFRPVVEFKPTVDSTSTNDGEGDGEKVDAAAGEETEAEDEESQ